MLNLAGITRREISHDYSAPIEFEGYLLPNGEMPPIADIMAGVTAIKVREYIETRGLIEAIGTARTLVRVDLDLTEICDTYPETRKFIHSLERAAALRATNGLPPFRIYEMYSFRHPGTHPSLHITTRVFAQLVRTHGGFCSSFDADCAFVAAREIGIALETGIQPHDTYIDPSPAEVPGLAAVIKDAMQTIVGGRWSKRWLNPRALVAAIETALAGGPPLGHQLLDQSYRLSVLPNPASGHST